MAMKDLSQTKLKIYSFFPRLLGLSVVIIALFAAASCGLPEGVRRSDGFEKTSVTPEYRCENDEVRLHWKTKKKGRDAIVEYGNHSENFPGDHEISVEAELVNSLPNPFEVKFKVDTPDGEVRTGKSTTVRDGDSINRTGLAVQDSRAATYKVHLLEEVFGDDVVVKRISLAHPRSTRCLIEGTNPSIDWQFDKNQNVSGYLTKDRDWSYSMSNRVSAEGIWYFSVVNELCFREKNKDLNLVPIVTFTLACAR